MSNFPRAFAWGLGLTLGMAVGTFVLLLPVFLLFGLIAGSVAA